MNTAFKNKTIRLAVDKMRRHPPVYGKGRWNLRYKPSELHAIATRIRQVADFFEQHPTQRVKGSQIAATDRITRVCAIGAVNYSRKVGLTWEPLASANCNAQETCHIMWEMGIVDANDATDVKAETFRSYMRHCADLLDRYADLKVRDGDTWQDLVETDPYFRKWLA